MTRASIHLLPALALGASAFVAATPAAAEPAERAVALCRAELQSRFPAGTIRNYRVTDISGNSRRTRVTISVTADQRYTFECAADSGGRVLTATFDPPRADAERIATGQR